jgi:pimeloyl-ACP methyl ester carboxylesterase
VRPARPSSCNHCEPFIAQVGAILDASDELRLELATVRVPTLVVTGSQDSLTPVGDAEELAELIPHARLEVISGAAHGLMVEAPNGFNDTVLRFLAEVDGFDAAIDEPRAAESA